MADQSSRMLLIMLATTVQARNYRVEMRAVSLRFVKER